MAKAILSVDDKVDEDDYENDIKEENIVDDEDYKEKDEEGKDDDGEDDVNDDDDKVVRLINKNEKHFYQDDDSLVLISFDENKDDDELPKSQTPWLHHHINSKSISKLDGYNQICELQYKCHSNPT
jgi:hypothetical protein